MGKLYLKFNSFSCTPLPCGNFLNDQEIRIQIHCGVKSDGWLGEKKRGKGFCQLYKRKYFRSQLSYLAGQLN